MKAQALARTTMNTLNPSSKISLGLLVTILMMAGSAFAYFNNKVDAKFDAQAARTAKLEDAIFTMSGELHEMKGEVHIININTRLGSHPRHGE